MSEKHHLRQNATCLNCGNIVNDRFCPHCGQENTETRQSFAHLVGHFFEDITHYDSGFWRTIKYLLFRPSLLTKEYLDGKRQAFVAPVRLYFFISFICFFLPSALPDLSVNDEKTATNTTVSKNDTAQQSDSDNKVQKTHKFRDGLLLTEFTVEDNAFIIKQSPNDYTSIKQLDSMQQALPPSLRYNKLQYRMAKKTINLFSHNTPGQISEKFREAFHHNLSKALFVYLPFFAFFIWLFHNKKRWVYFDHAIFSIHYFSYILLVITIFTIEYWLLDLVRSSNISFLIFITSLVGVSLWCIYYFYRAHHKFYKEHWLVSFLKSTLLLVINLVFIIFLLLFFTNYTMYSL